MKRRDVLLMRPARGRDARADLTSASEGAIELSCERLYMRYVDAEAQGTVDVLFDAVVREVNGRAVRLIDTSWLAHAEFKAVLDAILTKLSTTEDTEDTEVFHLRS